MEVRLTPDEDARLARIAAALGSSPEQRIKDAALNLLDQDERFRAAVRNGIAHADRGELIEESEMNDRVARLFPS